MKITRLTPNFEVSDIRKTVQFYQDILDFKLVMAVSATQDEIETSLLENKAYKFAIMQRDEVTFMFEVKDTYLGGMDSFKTKTIGASVSFYMQIEGIDDFYELIKSKKIDPTELKTMWYGMREFYIQDINGYVLGFAEKNE